MPSPLHLHPGECLPRGAFSAPRDGRLREFSRMLLIASLLLCLICTSCGAVGSGPAPPRRPVTVTVMPNSAQLFPGVNKQFNAAGGECLEFGRQLAGEPAFRRKYECGDDYRERRLHGAELGSKSGRR